MMERTQIYLTRRQRGARNALAQRSGRTQSEIIREAIDDYIARPVSQDRRQLMHRAAGMWADRQDFSEVFTTLRREGDRQAADDPE